ncbi:hypothetical protein ES332_A10G157900v1 [Gossypium tomentosum]|uniref:Uncharacterized protein n=1 Tax=Gossypium tomentosum TaxID=34277 RepID=A0A5D2NSM7_GOSTO|nr:hypothetical protein ES332_A10G157900v1 [Gossypium tomentosum]
MTTVHAPHTPSYTVVGGSKFLPFPGKSQVSSRNLAVTVLVWIRALITEAESWR